MFNAQYNMSFQIPETGTCDDRDEFKKWLKDTQTKLEKEIAFEEQNALTWKHKEGATLKRKINRDLEKRTHADCWLAKMPSYSKFDKQ